MKLKITLQLQNGAFSSHNSDSTTYNFCRCIELSDVLDADNLLFLFHFRHIVSLSIIRGFAVQTYNSHETTLPHDDVIKWKWKHSLTLSQCILAGPVCTGMPLECHWLTQCTLGYHWATKRILAGYTGTPLEKLSWNHPTLGCHWRNSSFCCLHWHTTAGTVTAHTRPDT